MRRARLIAALITTGIVMLAFAAPALAGTAHSGEGWYGETNDKVVTNAGFIVIAFFPLLIFCCSMLQWRLDKRKERRKAAEKARRARADVRGGW